MHSINILNTLLFFAGTSLAGLDLDKKNNLAVYWGQNSVNLQEPNGQGPLEKYCSDPNIDIIIIAFVTAVNNAQNRVELNLANQLMANETAGHPYPAPKTGDGIKACQKNGIKVLLSLGGAVTTGEQGFASKEAAETGAKKIWDLFGPPTGDDSGRPFGAAAVDGIDLDFEHEFNNMEPFVRKLRELVPKQPKGYLSAAPQCSNLTLPDHIISNLELDMVFVQFYNNPCALTNTPNFELWQKWSEDKNVPFFVGLPGSDSAAPSGGYIDPSTLSDKLNTAKTHTKMRGAMLWDASQAVANDNYHTKVKQGLGTPK